MAREVQRSARRFRGSLAKSFLLGAVLTGCADRHCRGSIGGGWGYGAASIRAMGKPLVGGGHPFAVRSLRGRTLCSISTPTVLNLEGAKAGSGRSARRSGTSIAGGFTAEIRVAGACGQGDEPRLRQMVCTLLFAACNEGEPFGLPGDFPRASVIQRPVGCQPRRPEATSLFACSPPSLRVRSTVEHPVTCWGTPATNEGGMPSAAQPTWACFVRGTCSPDACAS